MFHAPEAATGKCGHSEARKILASLVDTGTHAAVAGHCVKFPYARSDHDGDEENTKPFHRNLLNIHPRQDIRNFTLS